LFIQGKYSLGVPIIPQKYTKMVLKNGQVFTEEFFVEGIYILRELINEE